MRDAEACAWKQRWAEFDSNVFRYAAGRRTAMHHAAADPTPRALSLIELLVQSGAELDSRDYDGYCACLLPNHNP